MTTIDNLLGPIGGERHLYKFSPTQTNGDGGVLCGRVREANPNNDEGDGWVAEVCWANHPSGSSLYGVEPMARDSEPVPFSEYSQEAVDSAIENAARSCGMERRASNVRNGNYSV